jgi:small subunit ribosomal protein S4e
MIMHMKRFSMPGFWPLGRKTEKFVITPSPGPHPKQFSIPLRIVIRDVLGYAETADEAKKLIKGGEVMVDKNVCRNENHPVGLVDVVEFPSIKKQFRVVASRRGMQLAEIGAKEASKKLCAIKKKTAVRGGKFQLTLHDGRNVVVKENKYRPGDSLLIELPAQKILGHFEAKAGAAATIMAGKNSGATGKIKVIENRKKMTEKSRVIIGTKGADIETLNEYILVGEIK